MDHTTIDTARHYAAIGWPVFPVHTITSDGTCSCGNPKCGSPGKHPRTARGLNDASINPARIDSWFSNGHSNIALTTGTRSGVFVLDIDPRHGGRESFKALTAAHGHLPKTSMARTGGGGAHIYFRMPVGIDLRNSAGKLGPGLDVRANGGYVLTPPSATAGPYRWIGCDLPDPAGISDAPDWLVELIAAQATATTTAVNQLNADLGNPGFTLPDIIPDGQRNEALLRYAGHLRAQGLNEHAIVVALCDANVARCKPPLTTSEVRSIAGRYALTASEMAANDETPGEIPVVARLAHLSVIEYDRVRKVEAKQLGVGVGALDKAVQEMRAVLAGDNEAGEAVVFADCEPWPEPVDGAALLGDIAASARRYVILPEHGDTALALWVLLTHYIDVVKVAPILALVSPEKRCGKTTVLSWLARLAHRPLSASNITSPALFRSVEKWKPCLLIDEADSFLHDNEELRGVLNSGHTRDTAFVIRTVGDDHEPRRFCTWGAKAIALIGRLSDTLHDRSVVLEMRRKLADERVDRLRHASGQEFEELVRRSLRWSQDHAEAVRRSHPELPEALNDRAADNWEGLITIAEAAGGDWPDRARDAALALSGVEHEAPGLNVELLADAQRAFAAAKADRLAGDDLLGRLCADPERPWHTFARGRDMSQRQLAARLRSFGVVSKNIRFSNGAVRKGYELSQFSDAFMRYL